MDPHHDIGKTCRQAADAFGELARLAPDSRAAILESIAAALDAQRDAILTTCSEETALTIDELTPEFARMTGTLRMFAALVRHGSWCRAAIDTVIQSPRGHAGATGASTPQPTHAPLGPGVTAGAPHAIGPNHDIRSLLIPLGPVAVFGSSNFPLAYGVCGGDTASALAAGCPVIIKEHPAHPRTGRLLAQIARSAVKPAGFTEHILGYLYNEDPRNYQIAKALVQNLSISAVGFTGSTRAGLALEQLSHTRPSPIPVFAEMGSLNVVSIAHEAFVRHSEQIADELAAAVLSRVGQQCTKPGVVVLDSPDHLTPFCHLMRDRMTKAPPRRMLSRTVADNYYRRLSALAARISAHARTPLPSIAQQDAMLGVPMVFSCGEDLLEDVPEAREEIFGPAVVIAHDVHYEALPSLPNRLTHTIYAEGSEHIIPDLLAHAQGSAGRIIFNGPPTGVRVATSMVHGGPFPATNAPHTTAVGPRAIERWCRPVCYQNCPDDLLPPELQNANPRAIWRTTNGALTKEPLA